MELYPHQKRVFDLIMGGKNVILQAPTGSGKTRAALYPFVYSTLPEGASFRKVMPPKCIYSVPMRVLAKQFKHEYEDIARKLKADLGTSLKVRIQTGENPEDKQFEGDLIFATIDQTLSSYLLAPYSLPKRLANINAAAVAGSYLVFDEFHLFDPESTLPTTLHMLKRLSGIAPFILMTATFSRDMLEGLAQFLGAEIVPTNDEEVAQMEALASQANKHRHYEIAQHPLNAQSILDAHDRRSLVICNTVDRARYVYEQLTALRPEGVTIRLLHSRYLPEDRNHTEDAIRANFGKGQIEGSEIVVSTQAIEVGVDITSQVLHTELAPANSILQRAGRCARYEGDEGRVIIYPETTALDGSVADLVENTAPYNGFAKTFQPTLDAFTERHGQHLKFSDEQAIISTVHGPLDRQVLQNVRGDSGIQKGMIWVMRGDSKRDDVSQLVRQVVQQQVIIHPEPSAVLEAPFSVPSFGFHPGTLQKYVKDWIERGNQLDLEWCVQHLEEREDPDQTNRPEYRWHEVNDPKVAWLQPLLVVHPKLACYDPVLGFLTDRGGMWDQRLTIHQHDVSRERASFNYRLETYERHIELVYKAFDPEVWIKHSDLAARLERHFGWQTGSVYKAAQLAILLHDVGKLSIGWQGWVEKYQHKIDGDYNPLKAYAHTDSQTDEHRSAEKEMKPRRPWHAVEGAVAVLPTLEAVFGYDHPLCYAVFSAIARHHAPFSSSHQTFKLRPDALTHVQATFAAHMPNVMEQVELWTEKIEGMRKEDIHPLIIHPDDSPESGDGYYEGAFLVYELLARILRHADQSGTKSGML